MKLQIQIAVKIAPQDRAIRSPACSGPLSPHEARPQSKMVNVLLAIELPLGTLARHNRRAFSRQAHRQRDKAISRLRAPQAAVLRLWNRTIVMEGE
jgi:hypothetical protein